MGQACYLNQETFEGLVGGVLSPRPNDPSSNLSFRKLEKQAETGVDPHLEGYVTISALGSASVNLYGLVN